jgi:hypothetical protein
MRKVVWGSIALAISLSAAACGDSPDYIHVERPTHHNLLVSIGTEKGEQRMWLCETQRNLRLRPVPKTGQDINSEDIDMVRAAWADHYLSNERCPDIPVEKLPASITAVSK